MQRWMKCSRSPCRKARTFGLGCGLVWSGLLSGCTTVIVNEIPPCPVPTMEAIEQTVVLDGTAIGNYLGEIERFCDAIEAGR